MISSESGKQNSARALTSTINSTGILAMTIGKRRETKPQKTMSACGNSAGSLLTDCLFPPASTAAEENEVRFFYRLWWAPSVCWNTEFIRIVSPFAFLSSGWSTLLTGVRGPAPGWDLLRGSGGRARVVI